MAGIDILHGGGHYPQWVKAYLTEAGAEARMFQTPGCIAPIPIDEPEEFLEGDIGRGPVVLALGVHPEVLAELPYVMAQRGGKALIAAVEDPNWLRPGLMRQLQDTCRELGVEFACPKPFCTLEPQTPVIEQFCRDYAIGYPALELTIEDDGCGFNAPERIGDLVSTGRLGLIGMHERARLLGGTSTIQSESGQGTVVVVDVPLQPQLRYEDSNMEGNRG